MEEIIQYIYNIADDLPRDLMVYQKRLKVFEKYIVDLQSKYNKAQDKLDKIKEYVIEHPVNTLLGGHKDNIQSIIDKEV
jgi:hypothetical protein